MPIKKLGQPLPKLLRGSGRYLAGRCGRINDHVPRHAARHRRVERTIHADRLRPAARERPGHTPAHAGDAEVVAHYRNTRLAHVADDRFHIFEMLALARPVEQHVVPVCGVEIFDGCQLQTGRVDFLAQRDKLLDRPQSARVAGQSPAVVGSRRLVVARVVVAAAKIVDQVSHNVRSAPCSAN